MTADARIPVTIPREMRDEIRRLALDRGVSISEMIRRLLARAIRAELKS